jgi:hypothetical protein
MLELMSLGWGKGMRVPDPFFGRFTMNSMLCLMLFGLASGVLPGSEVPEERQSDAVTRWEYQILTKEQIIELGKKDLTAGLNRLGEQGWELAAVEAAFIFKRAKPQNGERIEDVKRRIALIEIDVQMWKDRVAWSERMLKKGFMSQAQVNGERMELKKNEITLDSLQRELGSLSSNPGDAARSRNPPRQPEAIKAPKPPPSP